MVRRALSPSGTQPYGVKLVVRPRLFILDLDFIATAQVHAAVAFLRTVVFDVQLEIRKLGGGDEGIEVEVIDPRTLVPLDMDTILESVQRTGRAMIVHEAVRTAGPGAEIASRINEELFYALDAPVWRLGAIDTPIPQDPELEQLCIPQVDGIAEAMRGLIAM